MKTSMFGCGRVMGGQGPSGRFDNESEIDAPTSSVEVDTTELGRKALLESLKEWIVAQDPHVISKCYDYGIPVEKDGMLWAFLEYKQKNVERAGKCLLASLSFREREGWTRAKMDVTSLSSLILSATNTYGVLRPKVDGNDCSRWISMSPEHFSVINGDVEAHQQSGIAMVMAMLQHDEVAQRNGISFVVDLRNLKYSIISKASRRDMHRGIRMMQGVMPLRLKRIYLLEPSLVTKGMIRVMESFIAPHSKIPKRIVSISLDVLQSMIEPSHLPSDFGGDVANGNIQEMWLKIARARLPLNGC